MTDLRKRFKGVTDPELLHEMAMEYDRTETIQRRTRPPRVLPGPHTSSLNFADFRMTQGKRPDMLPMPELNFADFRMAQEKEADVIRLREELNAYNATTNQIMNKAKTKSGRSHDTAYDPSDYLKTQGELKNRLAEAERNERQSQKEMKELSNIYLINKYRKQAMSDPEYVNYADIDTEALRKQYSGVGALYNPKSSGVKQENLSPDLRMETLKNQSMTYAGSKAFEYMTNDEKSVFAYLFDKKGKETADDYLKAIQETLNHRWGMSIAGGSVGTWLEHPQTFQAGLDSSFRGLQQIGKEEALTISPLEYANEYIGRDKTGVSKAIHDIEYTVGNMAPGIALSLATGGMGAPAALAGFAGSAMLGASAGGNNYASAKREGYSTDQARAYGIITGMSEGLMQYALGGISSLGSRAIASKVDDAIKMLVKNPQALSVISKVGTVGANAASEFTEEVLQNVVQRAVRNAVFLEQNNMDITKDDIYAGLLGGIMGAASGGIDVVRDSVYNVVAGNTQSATTPSAHDVIEPETVTMVNNMPNIENTAQGNTGGQNVTEQHTPEIQKTIREYQESTDDRIKEFMAKSIEHKGESIRPFELAPVSNRAANDIKNLIGVDASGYDTKIEQRMAEHIYAEHGPNGEADHSMADMDDIARIQYVLDNYDSIKDGGICRTYSEPSNGGKYNKKARTIVYEKRIDGTYYVVEAVPIASAKTTYVISAYMKKAVSLADAINTPAHTSENEAITASINNVLPNTAQVNTPQVLPGIKSLHNNAVAIPEGFPMIGRKAADAEGLPDVNHIEPAKPDAADARQALNEEEITPKTDIMPPKELTPDDYDALAYSLRNSEKLGLYFKDPSRVFDAVSGRNDKVRKILYNIIEKPFNDAGGQFGKTAKKMVTEFGDNMVKLGIKKGSKESQAVQRYGEGVKQDGTDLIPYTKKDLISEFPTTWENIIKAEQSCRGIYDGYVDKLNAMLENIYPYVLQNAQADVYAAESAFHKAEERKNTAAEVISMKETLWRGQGKDEAYIEHGTRQMREMMEQYTSIALAQQVKIDDLKTGIASGEIFRNKRVFKRDDYFHHFNEMSNGIQALANIFRVSNEISPNMVGVSDNTKPNTKWEGFLQKRDGGAYTEDAIGGMLKYITAAEYKLAFDPYVASTRKVVSGIQRAATNANVKNANGFIGWSTDWLNNLAGKTDVTIDKGVTKTVGRTAIKSLAWLNSRVKGNAVLGNFRSAVAQFYNIPNAMAYLPNPVDWANGTRLLAHSKVDSALQDIYSKSNFMSQRYANTVMNRFDEGVLKAPKKLAMWMIEFGDKGSSELMWWTAYSRYNSKKSIEDSMPRTYENAIDYADDVVRRSVGGRGAGEIPLVLQSQVTQILAPFQIEVNNSYQNIKEQLSNLRSSAKPEMKKRAALGLVAFEISTFAMNAISRGLFGDDVLGFDYLQAIMNSLKYAFDDEDDEKAGINIWQQFAGQTVGGIPFSNQIAALAGEDNVNEIFGDASPSRYGTGNLGFSGAVDLVKEGYKAVKGDGDPWKFADAAANIALPWGGKQLIRTAQGIDTLINGGSYKTNKNGEKQLQFPIEKRKTDAGEILKYAQAATFGKWALPEGQKYIAAGFPTLTFQETENYKSAVKAGVDGATALLIMDELKGKGKNSEKRKILYKDKSLTPEQKNKLDCLFINSKGWAADYSSNAWFEVSLIDKDNYIAAKEAYKIGVPPEVYLHWYKNLKDIDGEDRKERICSRVDMYAIPDKAKKWLKEKSGYKIE